MCSNQENSDLRIRSHHHHHGDISNADDSSSDHNHNTNNINCPPTGPNRGFPKAKLRFRQKRNFIFVVWTLIFIYYSVSAQIRNHSVMAKAVPDIDSWEDFADEDVVADIPKKGPSSATTGIPFTVSHFHGLPLTTSSSVIRNFNSNTNGPELSRSGLDSSVNVNGSTSNDTSGGGNGNGNGSGKSKYAANEIPGQTCTPPGIDDFPNDLFTQQQRQQGFVIIHFLVSMYIFYALALICDDYFVPSMECICEELKMPSDVAGATFMAIATSAPELFTNIIGTFITKGDIGIGTIVGSAVFNILAVAAVCGIGAGMVVPLEWWSVTRDCICYSLSVILLLIVLRDERIYWYEALVLVLVYSLYILAMYKNSSLKTRAERLVRGVEKRLKGGKTETTYNMKENGNGQLQMEADAIHRDEELVEKALQNMQAEAAEEKEHTGLLKPPMGEGCRAWAEWIMGWPVKLLYKLTVPDCREEKWRRWYPLTFFMCVVWIGILAYLVNWMMTVIGHTLQIPDSIMGLTFIAAGTSVPECVSSIIVARQGLGSMAISNSIGSNTFDILMCLGLPWLIRGAIIASHKEVNYIQINSTGLEYSVVMLITSLIILYTILAWNKFKLDKRVGFTSLFLYSLFLIFASLFELNVFFKVNLPTCLYHMDPDT